MLSTLYRFWFVSVLLVFVLVATLLQVTAARVQAAGPDVLALPGLLSSGVAVAEASPPVGEFDTPVVQEPLPSDPVELAPPDERAPLPLDPESLPVVERSTFSTVYESPGGGRVERLSTDPLNVQVDGEWVEIETGVERVGDVWQVEAHPLAPMFGPAADAVDAVTVRAGGAEVAFQLEGAAAGQVAAPFWFWDEHDTITYREVENYAHLSLRRPSGAPSGRSRFV